MTRSLLVLTVLLPLAIGCTPPDPDDDPDGPLVNRAWATEARDVISDSTPSKTKKSAKVGYDDEDERATSALEGFDEPQPGEVVIDLRSGVYLLEEGAVIDRAESVVLQGAGSHKSRLELDTEGNLKSIRIRRAKSVTLRGFTVVGYRGGGIFIERCPDVKVEDVHFAGSRYGLNLKGSVATIGTSVFAGCHTGIASKDTKLTLRETAFVDCWEALKSDDSSYDVKSCVFLDNRTVFQGRLDARTNVLNNIIFGKEQELGWEGKPGLAMGNLVHYRDLGERLGQTTNLELKDIDDFPDHVTWPKDFEIPAVHFTLERSRRRGDANPPKGLEELGLEWAERFAEGCQKALRKEDLPTARRLAQLAMQYLGEQSLDKAAPIVRDIAELVK